MNTARRLTRGTGRVLGVLVATLVLVGAAAAAHAQAHSTNDWTAISGYPPSSATCRAPASNYGSNAYADFTICWSGTNVWVQAFAMDTLDGDGWCAIAQINYQIDAGRDGVWDGHWHTRSTEVDCNPPWGDTSSWYKSNYPTRSLTGRACIGSSDGDEYACDSWR